MKQPKTIYLILILLILFIIIILVQIFKTPKPISEIQPPEEIQPTKGPSNEIGEFPKSEFKLLSSNITDQPISMADSIILIFNAPVNLNSLFYEIEPVEELNFSLNSTKTEVTIEPVGAWDFDTQYSIKVLKETKSQEGNLLDKDYVFTFKTYPYSGI